VCDLSLIEHIQKHYRTKSVFS